MQMEEDIGHDRKRAVTVRRGISVPEHGLVELRSGDVLAEVELGFLSGSVIGVENTPGCSTRLFPAGTSSIYR